MNDVDVVDMADVENPDLLKPIEKTNELKEWLVDYVGSKMKPENDEVNVEMVIKTIAVEFPEFVLVLAEENFIRGYQQAMHDIDEGEKLMIEDGLL